MESENNDTNPGFNQALLNLIEGSRFKGSKGTNEPRKLKRKEPSSTINITYEQNHPVIDPVVNEKPSSTTKNIPPVQPCQNRSKFVDMYSAIKEMRKDQNAPVDTMGAQVTMDPSADKEVQDYQLLIAQILSVQNRDPPVAVAMEKLIKHGLTIENMYQTDQEKIVEIISNINFKNNKAKYIKKTTDLIVNRYKGKVPQTLEELIKLPGIGRETATSFLNLAHKQNIGIGTDTHIHRISNRVAWVDTKTPEQTRSELESFVPREYWTEMNQILIGFGQQICTALLPKCEGCLLNSVCPTGIKNLEVHKAEENVLKKIKKENPNDLDSAINHDDEVNIDSMEILDNSLE